ncbi:MAG: F0F1 ATP synthase subunit B, partial [Pseudomonadota bacterium]|nr:F0F1 ATP synthase subunit B [Pseudomonadota bacterium]
MLSTPEFWVAASFVGFAGLLLYFGIPGLVAKALDKRAEVIRKELEEARKLRDEAQALLAEY